MFHDVAYYVSAERKGKTNDENPAGAFLDFIPNVGCRSSDDPAVFATADPGERCDIQTVDADKPEKGTSTVYVEILVCELCVTDYLVNYSALFH